ncbi:MAG: alpha/beta fold hydrolase [Jatrophihabitans sp.]|nr:MAG: alpha/beta fold hydrolase [Jatrophihabitans sp.]
MSALGTRAVAVAARWLRLPAVGEVPEGTVVELPGRGSTFVVDTGAPYDGAPVVVLLHALCCTGLLSWYPALAPLGRRYRVIAFDQRWHGRGIRSPRFRLEDCADDLAALADVLGIGRFVAVGYSMGSLVAQLAWRRHPERVDGAVLAASTAAFLPPGRHPRLVRAASRRIARSAAGLRAMPPDATDRMSGTDATDRTDGTGEWALRQFRQTSAAEIATAAATIARFDSTAWIHRMTVPTALVLTRRDRMVLPRWQHALARSLPDAAVYEIDTGHAGCVRASEVFVPALLAACASVTNRCAPERRPPVR